MSLVRALVWIAVYLLVVLAPLLALLVDGTQATLGFAWDLSMALGFAGTTMMGVQFLLTARFKRATAPFGIDIIYYFHRYVAVVAFVIILAHPILLASDTATLLAFLDPTAAPWYMPAGVASFVALAVLIVTSLWRKPMGIHYDAWRRWHTGLAVVALGLALAHIGGVGRYTEGTAARVVWWASVVLGLGVVAYVRIAKPMWMLRRPYEVLDVRPERGGAWTVAVGPRGHRGFDFAPGQFAWLTLRAHPWAMREHPFSMSSSPDPSGRLEFTIKELGDFSSTIKRVQVGEAAYVDGPYGAFTVDRHPAPGFVFIAGGIGIAPIMSMLRALAQRADRRPIVLFYAYRRWERMTFREAIEDLRRHLNLQVVFVLVEPPEEWTGETGFITAEVLDRHLPSDRRTLAYFLCGPEAMTHAIERALYRLGVPMARLHTELFDLV